MTTTTPPRAPFRLHPSLWLCAASLLAFPALGTLVSAQVNWDAEDFALLALMLAGLCGGIELAWHLLDTPRWRIGALLFAALMFFTVWAHLAADLFD